MTKDNSYTPQKIWSGHWNAMTKDKTTMLW